MSITEQVLGQVRAFMPSRAILTAAELDIFSRLARQPCTVNDLAQELGADPRALSRLLDALVSRDFLQKENGIYQNTEQGAVLDAGHAQSVLPMVMHLNELWDCWSDLTETVRDGVSPGLQPVTDKDQETCEAFIWAMHVLGRDLAQEIVAEVDLAPYQRLLDIGGAAGTYTMACLRQAPWLEAALFDLPRVLPLAEEKLRSEGFRHRVQLVAGDFYQDPLPQGCDLALLSAIIHQNSPQENLELYSKIYQALEPGGAILIRDHIMSEDRLQPPAGTLFALNMLVNTRGGDTYTFSEVQQGLEQAGFKQVKLLRSGESMDCLVQAHKS
ncbi:MAG: methyltransferase [Thermodesulfobacteriota bacterium]